MDAEIEKVQKELITENEFQKIRNQMESQFVLQNSSAVGIAEQLANYHVYYKDANLINTELQRYMKVTREDLQRVAKKYLGEREPGSTSVHAQVGPKQTKITRKSKKIIDYEEDISLYASCLQVVSAAVAQVDRTKRPSRHRPVKLK
jgi:hypothetical protein